MINKKKKQINQKNKIKIKNIRIKQKENKEENKANLLSVYRVNSYSSSKKISRKKFISSNDGYDKRKSVKIYENRMSQKLKGAPLLKMMTIDEFFEHFEAVATKIYNLIKENNDKSVNNTYYKIELSNIIINTAEETKYSRYLESKIKIYS